MARLTKRLIDALKGDDGDRIVWDAELPGFGVRVTRTGVRSFVVQYRNDAGRSRRLTIGAHGVWTLDQARTRARELMVDVDKGGDPAGARQARRVAPTVADLMDRYRQEHVAPHNAASTARHVGEIVSKRILPAMGTRKVADIEREDVERLHRQMINTPRLANHTVAVLSKAFNLAEVWRLGPQGTNPCKGIKRYAEEHRERFLSEDELIRLGQVLDIAATDGVPWRVDPAKPTSKHVPKERQSTPIDQIAVTVLRVLLFSGARLSEILELEWSHVDLKAGTLALPGSKGRARKPHPPGDTTMALIASVERIEGSPWVFPRRDDPSRHMTPSVVENAWQRIRVAAGIPDVRIHDLRHTVGTLASASGANAFVIRDLLRHKGVAMTSRYANKAHGPVKDTADAVGRVIGRGLRGGSADGKLPKL